MLTTKNNTIMNTTTTTTTATIASFVETLTKGTFGIVMLTATIPTMRKTNNPYMGRVLKVSYRTNVALGWDYKSTIEGRAEKLGIDTPYEVEKPKGKTWLVPPFILQSDKDARQLYLRTYTRNNSTTKSIFVLDGNIVTNEVTIEHIKSFMQAHTECKKQTEYGLVEDKDKVNPLDYKVEGILYIRQGNKVYNTDPRNDEMIEYIKNMG